jgi:hypothetical protein
MDQITTPFASLMRSYSKLDTLLYGDRENKQRQRENITGKVKWEAFTNRKNIIMSVMGSEGDFPVTNIGSAGSVPHPTQYDTMNPFLHPHITLLDFLNIFIINHVQIHNNNRQNTILYTGGTISKTFRSIIYHLKGNHITVIQEMTDGFTFVNIHASK